MKWFWTVRIYRPDGQYAQGVIETYRKLSHIDTIKDFYETLTGCKMLLEGMSETPPANFITPQSAFQHLYKERP